MKIRQKMLPVKMRLVTSAKLQISEMSITLDFHVLDALHFSTYWKRDAELIL